MDGVVVSVNQWGAFDCSSTRAVGEHGQRPLGFAALDGADQLRGVLTGVAAAVRLPLAQAAWTAAKQTC